jgi:hypothetical protein
LHKHREFFGEKWFRYHLASYFLTYISRRSNRLHCIGYAIRRCGILPVAAVLMAKVRIWLLGRMWKSA